MKITEYPTAQFLDEGDVLIKDGTNGTKQIKGSDLVYALFDGIPQMHREIFRGKSLGSTYTAAQKEAISSGTFHDLWIGDYWTINGHKYYIADFDLFYYKGGSTSLLNTEHHAVVILEGGADQTPRAYGGVKTYYGNSQIRNEGLSTSKSLINAAFPNNVMTYNSELPIGFNGDFESRQNMNCDVELLRAGNVAAHSKTDPDGNRPLYESQFKLFELDNANFNKYLDSSISSVEENTNTRFYTSSNDWRTPEDNAVTFNVQGYTSGVTKNAHSLIFAFFLLKG